MVWRLSSIAWFLWGGVLLVWIVFGNHQGMEIWVPLFGLWLLNGGLLAFMAKSRTR